MSLYYRPLLNSGLTTMYSDSGVTYQIDWVLVSMGAVDVCLIIS